MPLYGLIIPGVTNYVECYMTYDNKILILPQDKSEYLGYS